MMSLALGLLTMAAGAWGLYHWRGEFFHLLKGLLLLSFLCGGFIAFLAGISALRKKP